MSGAAGAGPWRLPLSWRLAVAWVIGAALASAPRTSAAQAVSGALSVFDGHRQVYFRYAVYGETGPLLAAYGAVRVWRVSLKVGEERGTLRAAGGLPDADVRFRGDAAALEIAVSHDLALGATREVRRLTSDVGTVTWVLQGGIVRFEPDLGLAGLRAIADLTVFTGQGVQGGEHLDKGLRTAFGFSVRPPGIPASLRVTYRFERYDLTATATTARYEEFRGLVVEASFPAPL